MNPANFERQCLQISLLEVSGYVNVRLQKEGSTDKDWKRLDVDGKMDCLLTCPDDCAWLLHVILKALPPHLWFTAFALVQALQHSAFYAHPPAWLRIVRLQAEPWQDSALVEASRG